MRDDVSLGQKRKTETGKLLADCGKKRDNDDPARVQAVAATILQEHEKAPRRRSEFAQWGPFTCEKLGPWGLSSLTSREVDGVSDEAGRASFCSSDAALRSRDVLFVPSAIAR